MAVFFINVISHSNIFFPLLSQDRKELDSKIKLVFRKISQSDFSWLPNVVHGIVLLSLNAEIEYRHLGHSVIIALWQIMVSSLSKFYEIMKQFLA